jgi:hypothetical protein
MKDSFIIQPDFIHPIAIDARLTFGEGAKSLHGISTVTVFVDWNAEVAKFAHLLIYLSLSPFSNLYHSHSSPKSTHHGRI